MNVLINISTWFMWKLHTCVGRCTHMIWCIYRYTRVHVHTCVESRGQPWTSFISYCPWPPLTPTFVTENLSLAGVITKCPRLAEHWGPGTGPHLHFQCWNYKHTPLCWLIHVGPGDWTQVFIKNALLTSHLSSLHTFLNLKIYYFYLCDGCVSLLEGAGGDQRHWVPKNWSYR